MPLHDQQEEAMYDCIIVPYVPAARIQTACESKRMALAEMEDAFQSLLSDAGDP